MYTTIYIQLYIQLYIYNYIYIQYIYFYYKEFLDRAYVF